LQPPRQATYRARLVRRLRPQSMVDRHGKQPRLPLAFACCAPAGRKKEERCRIRPAGDSENENG
jgi:hypothetical protein